MTFAANRHWFRSRLWICLVVATVVFFSSWLGSQWSWIRQRRALAAECEPRMTFDMGMSVSEETVAAPGMLWLFDEPGYVSLRLRFPCEEDRVEDFEHLTAAEKARFAHVQRIFPEAKVLVFLEVSEGDQRRSYLVETPDRLSETEIVAFDQAK